MLQRAAVHHLVAISGPAWVSFSRLTLCFHFEWIAAVAVAIFVAALRRFVEAVGATGRPLLAATPVCRLPTRPSHQVLHRHHHLPGNGQHLILHARN